MSMEHIKVKKDKENDPMENNDPMEKDPILKDWLKECDNCKSNGEKILTFNNYLEMRNKLARENGYMNAEDEWYCNLIKQNKKKDLEER